MKRTSWIALLFVIMLVLGGCGSKNPSASKFNPPAWIQGEWADEYGTNHYTFTSDNVILTSEGFSLDFKAMYKSVSVNETRTDTLYEVDITDAKYKFEKITETTLNYWMTASGLTVGPVVLIKR